MEDFLLHENRQLRRNIRNIVQKIHDANDRNDISCNANDIDINVAYWKGRTEGIAMVLRIIEEETGSTIDEILNPRCR